MYFSLYDDHKLDAKFSSGINYSTDKEELATDGDNPNNIRILGNWYHKHTASGKQVTSKWSAIIRFNADGKIYLFNDFFDVTGLLKQHEQ
jgi:ketosteroid isomerase-like protein